MASKKLLLKTEIEIRWKILIIIKEVLKFAAYFEQPETQLEQYYIRQHRHLGFIGWSLWRLAVIELCKLFGDSTNQKFNILKLLQKMDKTGYYGVLKFNTETLVEFNQRVAELIPTIKEVSRLRDKLYAHTDKDPFEQTDTFINTDDCFVLVGFAEEVIRTLAGTYLDTDYIVNTLYYDSRNFDFIHTLAKLEQDKHIALAAQNNMTFSDLFGHDPL
ncbi:hypothetical protein [Pedobacter sp. UYP1]|uniref:AbiU2 domain-containing protein n=1 Tax=Pedobacter sp. UYP1 TaxID=1756396 RepID=UPI003391389B